MSGVVLARAQAREELRKAVRAYLASNGEAATADLVHEVSLDEDVESSRVVAAMWTLVDDGEVEYEQGAQLRLLAVS